MLTSKQAYKIGKYVNFSFGKNNQKVYVSFKINKMPTFESELTHQETNKYMDILAFCRVVYNKIEADKNKYPEEMIYQNLITRFNSTKPCEITNFKQFLFNCAREYVNMDVLSQASLESKFLDMSKDKITALENEQKKFKQSLDEFVDKMYNKDKNYGL